MVPFLFQVSELLQAHHGPSDQEWDCVLSGGHTAHRLCGHLPPVAEPVRGQEDQSPAGLGAGAQWPTGPPGGLSGDGLHRGQHEGQRS